MFAGHTASVGHDTGHIDLHMLGYIYSHHPSVGPVPNSASEMTYLVSVGRALNSAHSLSQYQTHDHIWLSVFTQSRCTSMCSEWYLSSLFWLVGPTATTLAVLSDQPIMLGVSRPVKSLSYHCSDWPLYAGLHFI